VNRCDRCNQPATVHEINVVDGLKVETHLCEACAGAAGLGISPSIGGPSSPSVSPEASTGISHPALSDKPPTHPAGGKPGGKKVTAIPAAIGQFIITTRTGTRTMPRICSGCGLAFADFRQTGVLGCAECYQSFAEQLEGLIARSHAGAKCHTGRKPRRSADAAERQTRIRTLLRELHEAVSSEEFERAARLRDELRTLNVHPGAQPSNGPSEHR